MRFKGRKGRLRAVAIMMSLGLVMAVLAAAPASAEDVDGIGGETNAEFSGGVGNAPAIECAWALNDADNNSSWNNGMSYGQDDDPATPGGPCDDDGNGAAEQDPAGGPIHISVLPNPGDSPTQAYVELWGAVDSNNHGGTSVYWDVFHPNYDEGDPAASFKVQVDGTRYLDCDGSVPGDGLAGPDGMMQAAIDTGQVTSAAADNIEDECAQQKGLYYGAFAISKHQPYGTYRIEMTASQGGATSTIVYFIEVLPFYHLVKDFAEITFGEVQPNNHYWQLCAGDFEMNDNDGIDACSDNNGNMNNETSIQEIGNMGIGLDLSFEHMCWTDGLDCSNLKRIDLFDAKFGKYIDQLECIGTSPGTCEPDVAEGLASTAQGDPPLLHSFDDDIARTLCPNDVGKIEFSIYVENLAETGTYSGAYTLWARPNSGCPTDVGEVYPETAQGVLAPDTPSTTGYH